MRLVSEALSISYLFTWLFVVSTARDNLFIGELITISNGISKINLFRSIFKIYIFMATNWNERYDTLRAHFFANSFSNIDPECYAIQCNFPVRWENALLHRRIIFFYIIEILSTKKSIQICWSLASVSWKSFNMRFLYLNVVWRIWLLLQQMNKKQKDSTKFHQVDVSEGSSIWLKVIWFVWNLFLKWDNYIFIDLPKWSPTIHSNYSKPQGDWEVGICDEFHSQPMLIWRCIPTSASSSHSKRHLKREVSGELGRVGRKDPQIKERQQWICCPS